MLNSFLEEDLSTLFSSCAIDIGNDHCHKGHIKQEKSRKATGCEIVRLREENFSLHDKAMFIICHLINKAVILSGFV